MEGAAPAHGDENIEAVYDNVADNEMDYGVTYADVDVLLVTTRTLWYQTSQKNKFGCEITSCKRHAQ